MISYNFNTSNLLKIIQLSNYHFQVKIENNLQRFHTLEGL